MRVAVVCFLFLGATSALATPPPVLGDRELAMRLIAALNDPDPDIRANLSQALAKIGPAAVEPLVEALANSVTERRAGALGLLGPVAKSALPQLLICSTTKKPKSDGRRHRQSSAYCPR